MFPGMLRLVHAFVEAAPMLLLQLHVLLATSKTVKPINELDPIRDEPIAGWLVLSIPRHFFVFIFYYV